MILVKIISFFWKVIRYKLAQTKKNIKYMYDIAKVNGAKKLILKTTLGNKNTQTWKFGEKLISFSLDCISTKKKCNDLVRGKGV